MSVRQRAAVLDLQTVLSRLSYHVFNGSSFCVSGFAQGRQGFMAKGLGVYSSLIGHQE